MITKVLEIMKNNKGIITSSQIENYGISRVYLSKMVEKNIIELKEEYMLQKIMNMMNIIYFS